METKEYVLRKDIPNLLSLSRIPLGVLTLIFAQEPNWNLALWCLVIGIVTDDLDGVLARRWKATSEFGANVLEPVCDLALVGGALLGLLFAGHFPWWAFALILVLSLLGQIGIFTVPEGTRLRKVLNGFMPFNYLVVLSVVTWTYARLTIGWPWFWWWVVLVVIPVVIWRAHDHKVRLNAWRHGIA